MGNRHQDTDMSVAAACAAGEIFEVPIRASRAPHQPRALSARVPMPQEDCEDLPSVDDLAIAARAAAGAPDPVGPVLRQALGEEAEEEDELLAPQPDAFADTLMQEGDANEGIPDDAEEEEQDEEASSSDETMSQSSEETSSDSESSDDDDDDAVMAMTSDAPSLRVQLKVGEDESVKLVVKRDAYDPEELRAEINRMEREGPDPDAEDEEEVEAAKQEQASALPEVEPLEVDISPDDVLLPVGQVSAIVGSIIVVQAPENGRAVTEGSVLCLESRQPIGRVEEVFGPVMQPLYSLRYACGPVPPPELAVGAQMCSVERLTQYVLPEELYGKGYDAGEADGESEPDVEEFEFSDDEKEAAWRREQRAQQPPKRKAQDGPRGRGGARGGRHNGRQSNGSADPGPGGGRSRRGRGRNGGNHEWNQGQSFHHDNHAAQPMQGFAGPGLGSIMPGYAPFGPAGYGPPQSAGPAYTPHQQGYAPGQPDAYGSFGYPPQYGSYDQYGQGAYDGTQYPAQPSYMPPQQTNYGPQGMQGGASVTDAYMVGGQGSARGRRGRMQQGRRSRPPQ